MPVAYRDVFPARKRRSKFGAVTTVVDGVKFASKKEAKRYSELRLLERAGEIAALILQPKLYVTINNILVCTYIADFGYLKDGQSITEDCKGVRTPVYRLKKKLVKALYGVEVLET